MLKGQDITVGGVRPDASRSGILLVKSIGKSAPAGGVCKVPWIFNGKTVPYKCDWPVVLTRSKVQRGEGKGAPPVR
ncbi:hypothetical protein GCM10023203_39690 [Actinomycetospora straminea]|uniref:Uncharacterized protein n=1 Tax=Actinomycetospora straminea TaxID=663607 RepID=A0ABP9EPU7_9PSEU